MKSLKTILVGSHFVPPAKVVLQCLRQETEVLLTPEPENPYDGNAIKVWVKGESVDHVALAELDAQGHLMGMGTDAQEVVATPLIPLGHVAASGGKPLAKAMAATGLELGGTNEIHELVRGLNGDWARVRARIQFVGELFILVVEEAS